MDESYQSSPSSDMSEGDIQRYFEAGLSRDMNLLRTMAVIQLNNLSNTCTNISAVLSTVNPAIQGEFDASAVFLLTDAKHYIETALGHDRGVPLDPQE